MRVIFRMPVAENAEQVTIVFDCPPPEFEGLEGKEYLAEEKFWYSQKASALLDALEQHTPQGFREHLYAEMARRHASVVRGRG